MQPSKPVEPQTFDYNKFAPIKVESKQAPEIVEEVAYPYELGKVRNKQALSVPNLRPSLTMERPVSNTLNERKLSKP